MTIARRIRMKLLYELGKQVSLADLLDVLRAKRLKRGFVFNDETLDYLFHSYNNMGLTERSVEIPIVRQYLRSQRWQRVLEVGNVTNYYEDYFSGLFPNKVVVDKIEQSYNVITADIATFVSEEPFDFVFSISTFEHMDSDRGRNPDHRPGSAKHGTVAADNIIHCYENLLAHGGTMVITAPLGYTSEWDETFRQGALDDYGFTRLRRLLISRVSEQEWAQESSVSDIELYQYGHPYPYANHVGIVEISK